MLGKEHPPKPEIIKGLAKVLAADPDVLFRLCPSTDPDVLYPILERPKVLELVRLVMAKELSDEQLGQVEHFIVEANVNILTSLLFLKKKTIIGN